MSDKTEHSLLHRLKLLFIGDARDIRDSNIFHKISLIAVLAWVGLGADGLSSSCYGPQEAFLALGQYHYLGIFVALGTAFTIIMISMSYSQTIELFPSGGGGYIVASKLHSPIVGMISGSTLLIDYMLTISVSVAACADAVFSLMEPTLLQFKVYFILLGIGILILVNLRGVKESIKLLAPIFLLFVITHLFGISYSLINHLSDFGTLSKSASENIGSAHLELGFFGMFFLIMKAFSMGAGTFTGIEAVSNGLPVLREPKVRTGKRTMRYMAFSLAFTSVGLMLAYNFYGVEFQLGKTLNATLFEAMSSDWGITGSIFVYLTLFSEAAILIVAAQAGFLDGPRILANMASDRWMPSGFALLSNRLVTKNGILLMGISAALIVVITGGDIVVLVVLYSINVFITFILTESGMVKHWIQVRHLERKWKRKIFVNASALVLDIFILSSLIYFKFLQGGWATIIITGFVIILAIKIKKHYSNTSEKIKELNSMLNGISDSISENKKEQNTNKTAIILVNGYNGLGLHCLLSTIASFKNMFERYIFVQVGLLDSTTFKESEDAKVLKDSINLEVSKYCELMKSKGYESEYYTAVGIDPIEEIVNIVDNLNNYFIDTFVVSGQLCFEKETLFTKLLHNNIVYSLQRRFLADRIPYMIMPIKIS